MVDSKRRVPKLASGQPFGSQRLIQAIAQAVAGLAQTPSALAVAVSGGPDSAMLAVHASIFAQQESLPLHFFYIHHGLQESAEPWQAHVHDLAQRLRVPCHSLRIQVDLSRGDGVEAAARDARYAALARLAEQTGVDCVLLAHHQNDQAETVLLRLLRGAGPTGLAAMAPVMRRGGLTYLRPWLNVDRAVILSLADAFTELTGWRPVRDPTNSDDQYTRAALRERLTPALNQRWPGWQRNLARHARQSAQLAQVLDEVCASDFAGLDPSADGRDFSLAAWRELPPARQALVLRHWLSLFDQPMPSDARLQDIMRQLRGLHAMGHDRQMRVRHGAACICCIKGRVVLDEG